MKRAAWNFKRVSKVHRLVYKISERRRVQEPDSGDTRRRYHRYMASPTSTIRVSRATHDLLAAQARERGVSLAAMLSDIADDRRLAAMWQSERDAARVDAASAVVRAENDDWDAASDDGIL